MTTTVFNLTAVDRIEVDVVAIEQVLAGQAKQISAFVQRFMAQEQALADLAKVLADFISSLGAGDQALVDKAALDIRGVATQLREAVARDKP